MRVLGLSSVFPNPAQPRHGVFVRQRWAALAARHEITVVAPIPWFPLASGRMLNRPVGVPRRRREGGLEVYHPRWLSPPAVGKSLDGWLYAASVRERVEELHRREPFDLIDAHFAYPDGFAACRLGARLGLPVAVTLRGTLPDLARRPSRRWALRHTLERADVLLSVSGALADDAARLGVDRNRVTVAPNGVDTARFFPRDAADARRQLELPADRPIVISVGALREVKGHHHLLRAVAALRDAHPGLLTVIVGGASISDDRSDHLRGLAAELGLAQDVVWAGSRPHEEIPSWLAAADVFALASRREGCCNAILEALACGRPVVATDVGGNGEILSSRDAGRLVPAADPEALAAALDELLAHRPAAERVCATVADRRWERTAVAVEEAWNTARRNRVARRGRVSRAPIVQEETP